jgi:hypothetical protein
MVDKPYGTTLAKAAAKWYPSINLAESNAVMRLTNQKIAAFDLSPAGLQAMIGHIDRILPDETHLYRLKIFKEARAGLAEMAAGAPAPSRWAPIWDVFAYWPAAEEIIAARPPLTPEQEEWLALSPLERLKRITTRKPHNSAPDSSQHSPESSQHSPDSSPDSPRTSPFPGQVSDPAFFSGSES